MRQYIFLFLLLIIFSLKELGTCMLCIFKCQHNRNLDPLTGNEVVGHQVLSGYAILLLLFYIISLTHLLCHGN